MRPVLLGLAAALFAVGTAHAQTTTQNSSPPTSGTPAVSSGQPTPSVNDNQAVATNTDAATPVHGHNSFTKGEARRRIVAKGFTRVTGLHKDGQGVWRGQAIEDGQATGVWLDYKGDVGTSQS